MNSKQDALRRLDELGKTRAAAFFDIFRKLWNELCPRCQAVCGRMGAKIKYEILCEECRIKAKAIEKKANEVLYK